MRNGLLLTAKIVLFAVVLVWILGFLLVAFSMMDDLTKWVVNWMGYSTTSPMVTAFIVWYVITVVALAVLVAYRGFLVVGKWVKPHAD